MATSAHDWIWDGGRPCLDLVNTLRDRWNEPRELLVTPADLAEWAERSGLAAAAGERVPEPEPALLEEARGLREAVDRLLIVAREGTSPEAADIATVNRWAVRAHEARPLLKDDGGVLRSADPAPGVERALAGAAADTIALVAAGETGSVRVCSHERCGLRFHDRSPGRNRRWCSMTRCGNRAKAARHYGGTRRSGTKGGERPS